MSNSRCSTTGQVKHAVKEGVIAGGFGLFATIAAAPFTAGVSLSAAPAAWSIGTIGGGLNGIRENIRDCRKRPS